MRQTVPFWVLRPRKAKQVILSDDLLATCDRRFQWWRRTASHTKRTSHPRNAVFFGKAVGTPQA